MSSDMLLGHSAASTQLCDKGKKHFFKVIVNLLIIIVILFQAINTKEATLGTVTVITSINHSNPTKR
jgi:uncharacterized integral membrane protein